MYRSRSLCDVPGCGAEVVERWLRDRVARISDMSCGGLERRRSDGWMIVYSAWTERRTVSMRRWVVGGGGSWNGDDLLLILLSQFSVSLLFPRVDDNGHRLDLRWKDTEMQG